MPIRLITSILIFTSLIKTESSSDLIQETRYKIAGINLSFLGNNYPGANSISELGKLLNVLHQEEKLRKIISVNKNSIVRLTDSYKAFENLFERKLKVDSLKNVFRNINNEFNSLFGNYFLDELRNSPK